MSFSHKNFINFSKVNGGDIFSIFDLADHLSSSSFQKDKDSSQKDFAHSISRFKSYKSLISGGGVSSLIEKKIRSYLKSESEFLSKRACLLFLEPSTRTQMSFELALQDEQIPYVVLHPETSSLKKKETLLDTLLNLEAMGIDLFIIRHGNREESLVEISKKIKTPIISAGEGVSGHPTQALLDCYTIFREKKKLKGEKVLFVGDIKYSRVVSSNLELMSLMGMEMGFCAPDYFLPEKIPSQVKVFKELKEGMEWASVVMALRSQFERHEGLESAELQKEFIKRYSLTKEELSSWKKEGMILHPGPYNRGIEIQSEVLEDPRSFIYQQVSNGRRVRRALIHSILKKEI